MKHGFTEEEFKILDVFVFVYLGANGYLLYDGYVDCTAYPRNFEGLLIQLRNILDNIKQEPGYYDALVDLSKEELREMYDIMPDISHMDNPNDFTGPVSPTILVRGF